MTSWNRPFSADPLSWLLESDPANPAIQKSPLSACAGGILNTASRNDLTINIAGNNAGNSIF